MVLPIGGAGMSAVPVLGAVNGWPLWVQVLASGVVAFMWLTLLSWVINLFKRKPKAASPGHSQTQSDSPGAQQQQAQSGSNSPITQIQTGDTHLGDVYNFTINITPEAQEAMIEVEAQKPIIRVESHGQLGGITAGIVNILGDLGPKVELTDITHTELPHGHRYETFLTAGSNYAVPEIRITAFADSIQSLYVAPQRGGMHMFGHTGKREGYHFTTLQNAAGKYRVRVTTTNPEEVKIDVG